MLLASNPKETSSLRLPEEFRDIKDSFDRSKNRNLFKIYQGDAVRIKDLRRLVLDINPHIIHFSGHGNEEGIHLENEQGFSHLISGSSLKNLFLLFESIHCIILNTCYSEFQANSLRNIVPYIIGMKEAIGDKIAIRFSNGFYDALAAKRTIEDSFEFGKNAVEMSLNQQFDINRSLQEEENIFQLPVLLVGKKGKPLFSIDEKVNSKKTLENFSSVLSQEQEIQIISQPQILCASSKQFSELESLGFQEEVRLLNELFPNQVHVEEKLNTKLFTQLLMTTKFDVVHLSAIAKQMGGDLVFSKCKLKGTEIEAEPLEEMSANDVSELLHESDTKLLFLSSCHSLDLAIQITPPVNIIATPMYITSKEVINWLESFYSYLSSGLPLSKAMVATEKVYRATRMRLIQRKDFKILNET